MLNLAYQSREIRNVFWVDGSTVEKFSSSLVFIGTAVGLVKDGMSHEDTRRALGKWLRSDSSENWLLVVNNLTYKEDLVLRMLTVEKGTLVVSTWREEVSLFLQTFEFKCFNMTIDEAKTTFLQYSGLNLDDSRWIDENDIRELNRLLDHSPLAIAITASFVRETRISVAEYIENYRGNLPHHEKLRPNPLLRPELKNFPTAAIMTVCDISFSRIKRELPSAADLLQLMSMLNSRDVPLNLLAPKVIKAIGLDKGKNLEAALKVLNSFSFVTMCNMGRCQVHDLVAVWIREQLGDRKEHFTRISLALIEELFLRSNSSKIIDYLPHARAVLSHSKKIPKLAQTTTTVQLHLVDILYHSNRLVEARKLNEACAKYCEEVTKDGKALVLCNIHRALIEQANKGDRANEWFRKARDGSAKIFGQNDSRTLDITKRHAMLLEAQGDYRNAILTYAQAENWSRQTNNNPFTIEMMHSKALVYDKQGNFNLAAEAYTQAQQQSIKTYDEQHLSTIDIQNNYAITRRKQGHYDEALRIFRDIFEVYERTLGRHHQSTLNVQGNIAVIYGIQGRPDALQALERLLELKERFVGKESVSTLSTLGYLALLLSKLGSHREAILRAQQALKGYQKVLGNDDSATLEAIANCAVVYDAMGDMENAKQHYLHARKGQTKLLGPEHPSTLKTVADLSSTLVRLRSYEEALDLQDQVQRGYANIYGHDHPFTARAERERGETLRLRMLAEREEAGACFAGSSRMLMEAGTQEFKGKEKTLKKRLTWMGKFGKSKN